MAWTFWMPSAPTGLTGTLVVGGTLLPNTTYYFKVQAWCPYPDATSRVSVSQAYPQIFSPYSETFSITTDDTNLSVALTWDKVFKKDGVTEVSAYEVLVSTSDNFDTAPDDASIYPNSVGYYTAATLTNSYTVTKPAASSNYYKNIKDGIPQCLWDGSGTCTFKSLYDAMAADAAFAKFGKKLTSFNDENNIWGYQFLAFAEVKRYSGDSAEGVYSFISKGDLIFFYGTFRCGSNKYYVEGSKLFFNSTTHGGSNEPFVSPRTGSVFKNNILQYCFGTIPNSKSWGGMGQNYTPFTNANVYSSNNYYYSFEQVSGAFELPTTALVARPIGRPTNSASMGYVGDATWNDGSVPSTNWTYYFSQASTGKVKNIIMSNKSTYLDYNSRVWGMDLTDQVVQFRYGTASFVDCIFRYNGLYGLESEGGWNPYVTYLGNYTPLNMGFYIGKTVLVTVKDSAGIPIEGAKVKFESNNGINITKANTLAGVCKAGGSPKSVGNNYEEPESTVFYDGPDIYLRILGYYEGGISNPVIGDTYWYGAEKITILSRDASPVAWEPYTYHFTATRGVDNTPITAIISMNANLDHKLVQAKDYLETDENGFTFNETIFKAYKGNSRATSSLEAHISNGSITEYDWSPIKITVSVPGKKDKVIYVSEEFAIAVGTQPINIEVNMDSQIPIIIVDGDKKVLNLLPADTQNSAGYTEL